MTIPAVLPSGHSQAIVVAPLGSCPKWSARVVVIERREGSWARVLGPFAAVAGRNGFASPGEKREGDGKTPSGIFALEHAFGYAPKVATALPYRQIEEDDVWIDDPLSDDYNKWTKKEKAAGRSVEEMKRRDNLYRYGIVVGYNRDPVVKGLGSAIFLHVWQNGSTPTSGCVALSEEALLAILGWLDPSGKPLAAIGCVDCETMHVQRNNFCCKNY
jgi:L,D-peptidoglycan transpeptidase YkuD (ErfK/YbiS/YcfS/YnhG family)